MVKQRKKGSRKKRVGKGFFTNQPKARKINVSTGYETCSEQLTGFGGFLALIKFLDLVAFREIFQFAFRPPLREPKLGHYRMVVGILCMCGWMPCCAGFSGLSGCRRPARFGDTWTVWGSIRGSRCCM